MWSFVLMAQEAGKYSVMHGWLRNSRIAPTDLVATLDRGKKDDGIPQIRQAHVGKRLKGSASPDSVF